jgi:hypothetical protein
MLVHLSVARLAGRAGLLRFHLRRVLDLRRLAAAIYVSLARAMTRLTASNFALPVLCVSDFGMDCVRKVLELVFVTELASLAADVVVS